jgi:hypothetical protein
MKDNSVNNGVMLNAYPDSIGTNLVYNASAEFKDAFL